MKATEQISSKVVTRRQGHEYALQLYLKGVYIGSLSIYARTMPMAQGRAVQMLAELTGEAIQKLVAERLSICRASVADLRESLAQEEQTVAALESLT